MSSYIYKSEPDWTKGEVISSNRLNNIETGIRQALAEIRELNVNLTDVTEDTVNHTFEGFAPNQTLASLTQREGFINATFQDIYIDSAHITDRADGTGNQNIANTVVKTNGSGIIPSHLLPSYVDDILEFPTKNDFPSGNTDNTPDDGHNPTGPEKGKIYVDTNTGRSYRWSGSEYIEVGVIHLNYNDDNADNANNNNNLSNDEQFGAANTHFVDKVIQTEGQIQVTHRPFNLGTTWSANNDNTSTPPTLTISIGGNLHTTQNIPTASTFAFGATKLNHNTVSSTETNNSVTIHTFSNDDTLAITSLGLKNAFDTMNSTVTAQTTDFVSGTIEENGIVTISTRTFNPFLTHTVSTGSTAPYIGVKIADNESPAVALDIATTANYGVTILSDTQDSTNSTVAATPKGVWDAINQLDYTNNDGSTLKTPTNITQTDGKIAVTYENIQTATTGVYGVTQLSSTQSTNEEGYAATPKGVWNAINQLNSTVTVPSNSYITSITETSGILTATTASFAGISITKSQISDLSTITEGLMTPAQKNSIELFDDLMNNFTFNITLQLPTNVTWSRDEETGIITAVPTTFATDTTVTYQMNDGNGWVAYDGTQSYTGDHTFKAHVARSHAFNGTTYTAEADINETYEYTEELTPEGE